MNIIKPSLTPKEIKSFFRKAKIKHYSYELVVEMLEDLKSFDNDLDARYAAGPRVFNLENADTLVHIYYEYGYSKTVGCKSATDSQQKQAESWHPDNEKQRRVYRSWVIAREKADQEYKTIMEFIESHWSKLEPHLKKIS